jgi:hypothetical protein
MEIDPAYDGQVPSGRLAALATRQHGVVARWQLEALGLRKGAVDRWVARAQLHLIHRGVYAVGHTRLTTRARWLAAVLACGPEAVLSHHAAAALWDLRPAPQARIDVTAPGKRDHIGVRCHVVRALAPSDRTMIDAIPVTTLHRTLLDYAEVSSPRQLAAALEAAQRRDLLDVRKLEALLARSPGRRGAKPLWAALPELHDEPPWTQSQTERRFLELIAQGGMPAPEANVLIVGELVDCVWRGQRLVVEVDSWEYHHTKRSFEADRRRDAKLQIAGWRVARVTDERVWREPRGVIDELARLLGDGAAGAG